MELLPEEITSTHDKEQKIRSRKRDLIMDNILECSKFLNILSWLTLGKLLNRQSSWIMTPHGQLQVVH